MNIIINFDKFTGENRAITQFILATISCPSTHELMVGDPVSQKVIEVLNLINHQSVIDKIYLYAKNPYEPKHQLLIKKQQEIVKKYSKEPKALIECSNDMKDAYKSI